MKNVNKLFRKQRKNLFSKIVNEIKKFLFQLSMLAANCNKLEPNSEVFLKAFDSLRSFRVDFNSTSKRHTILMAQETSNPNSSEIVSLTAAASYRKAIKLDAS